MKPYILVLLYFTGGGLFAQDPHFSQYFASPLTLNPAYAGFFEGPFRFSTNFRNQWLGSGEPFSTGTVAFETKMLAKKLEEDVWGVGLSALYDRTAAGTYNSTYFTFSTAYHKQLDEDGYQHLGIGFQGNYGTRVLDYNRISFNEQFSSRGFDLSLPNGETFVSNVASYFDANIGLMYNYHGEGTRYYLGSSLYHINQPSISFLGSDKYVLPARYTFHGGASRLTGSHGEVYLSAQYMQQSDAKELVAGLTYGHSIFPNKEDQVIYVGLWYRANDAVYPYLGYHWSNLQAGFSYDVTTSRINLAAKHYRSFEFSLVYTVSDNSRKGRFTPCY